MEKVEVFDVFSDGLTQTWRHQLIQGVLFILFGLLIALFPQLLVVMAAAFFMTIGVVWIVFAWGLRRFIRQYRGFRSELFELF